MTRIDYDVADATISECGEYRYDLTRVWDERRGLVAFLMLNPSTADGESDDPTIRRCVSFAQREGYGGLLVVNLYGLRATDPSQLWHHADPIGVGNDRHLRHVAQSVPSVVCAWGANAPMNRVNYVVTELKGLGTRLLCLGKTRTGAPRHPLYLRKDTPLEKFP